jgi:hypothetical protein
MRKNKVEQANDLIAPDERANLRPTDDAISAHRSHGVVRERGVRLRQLAKSAAMTLPPIGRVFKQRDALYQQVALLTEERDVLRRQVAPNGLVGSNGKRQEGILLNTMPKSGSIYVARSLQKILGLDFMYLGNGYNLIDQIALQAARKFCDGGYVSQNHFAASTENLQILEHFKLKMVLHLRDPRQALLSWVHHLDRITDCNDESEFLLYFTPRTPPGYFGLSLSRKLDWQIENCLPDLIAWTKRWLEIADRGTIPILITHQNDLRFNEKAFFDSILAFYQVSRDYVPPNLPKTDETHFRRADPAEWRRTFSPEQAAQAASKIPDELRTRFSWDGPA